VATTILIPSSAIARIEGSGHKKIERQEVKNKNILLIISGGIAAYKVLDLIRRMRERGASVRCILTKGGAEFVTPLSIASLSGNPVYQDLFSLKDETEMGHIRLSREADLILVAPASANIMAKMVQGFADDLATTTLLATNKPVFIAPAMNVEMWNDPATQENIRILEKRGARRIGPAAGDMACGEVGEGRLMEPADILAALDKYFRTSQQLKGLRVVVTAGATREPIDPIRFLSNYSSGKQGYAIAEELASRGADTILVTGHADIPAPANCQVIRINTAEQMLNNCLDQLPADVAVCAAAVSDWRVSNPANAKIKKQNAKPELDLIENPDILKSIATAGNKRPQLVIGFAAETENLVKNAQDKLSKKSCDWMIANDVGKNPSILGGDENQVHFITKDKNEDWPKSSKQQVAENLADRIAQYFKKIA
jgi:phosphopantothenoylcysteine decarboxylase/phosphopantothenate--cysteine ligase